MVGHPARFYHSLTNKAVQCYLCPRQCVLKPGDRGYCFARRNDHGQLVLTTYGLSSGFAVDPIEKKPLHHFLPGTQILSFGTIGCNLGCRFCQNWRISKPKNAQALGVEASPLEIARKALELGVPSVAFTYNEPIVSTEFVIDTAKECQTLGIKTVAVTAGYISDQARLEFFEHIDAANVDLKAFSHDFYARLCNGSLAPVLDTLLYIKHKTDVWLEITNLVIPDENNDMKIFKEMARWIKAELGKDVPLHVSAFHPDHQMMNTPRTGVDILQEARQIALDEGLLYVYTGNVSDEEGGSTCCPACKKCVIKRAGFKIMEYHIKKSKCEYCQATIAGVFS
ncbi:MAG: AmmeMemoRadiSam system radical SAM enzyme [Candidatus Omnitrophica bacterium]|nr:AmmeMemoRadiSam system radical SAM enzyme [Candidatus Omnitrophota bacterium]